MARLDYLREHHAASLAIALRAAAARWPFGDLVQWGEGIDDDLFDRFAGLDPDPKKRHLQWLIRAFLGKRLLLDDFYKIPETMTAFVRYVRLLDPERRDIGRYHGLADVWAAVAEFAATGAAASEREADRLEREAVRTESEILLEDDWTVVVPTSQRAAVWWGRGTRWCTAATGGHNYFDSYHHQGPLVVFVRRDGAKFQVHAPTQQFMDAADHPISRVDADELHAAVTSLPSVAAVVAACVAGMPPHQTGPAGWLEALSRYKLPARYIPHAAQDAETAAIIVEQERPVAALRALRPDFVTRELALAAVTSNCAALAHVPEAMRDDEICAKALDGPGSESPEGIVEHIPEAARTAAFYLALVRRHPRAYLTMVPVASKTKEMAATAVAGDAMLLPWVPADWRDRTMVLDALRGHLLALLPAVGADTLASFSWEDWIGLAAEQSREAVTAMRAAFPAHLAAPVVVQDAVRRWPEAVALLPSEVLAMLPTSIGRAAVISAPTVCLGRVPTEWLDVDTLARAATNTPGAMWLFPDTDVALEACRQVLRAAVPANLPRLLVTASPHFRAALFSEFGKIAADAAPPEIVAPEESEPFSSMMTVFNMLITQGRRPIEAGCAALGRALVQRHKKVATLPSMVAPEDVILPAEMGGDFDMPGAGGDDHLVGAFLEQLLAED